MHRIETDDADLVARTTRALLRDRAALGLPHLGSNRAYASDVRAIVDARGLAVRRRRFDGALQRWDAVPGVGLVLEIPPGLPDALDRFLVLRAAERQAVGAGDRDGHETYFLAIYFSRAERRARGGGWVRERLRTLRAVGQDWYAERLPRLYRAALSVQRHLQPYDDYQLGRDARARASYAAAEAHFRRGLLRARRLGEAEAEALCWTGLGHVRKERGESGGAGRCYARARRAARRAGSELALGGAYHARANLAFEAGERDLGMRLARRAFDAYPDGHPFRDRLAHDVGLLLHNTGFFAEALRTFLAVAPRITDEASAMMVSANIARAAACTGDRRVYRAAWERAWRAAEENPASTHTASTYLHLGVAAISAGEWKRAATALAEGQVAAQQHGEAVEVERIRGAMQCLRAHERIEALRGGCPGSASMSFVAAVEAAYR